MVKTQILEPDGFLLKPTSVPLPAVGPWVDYLTLVFLHFLLCKLGVQIVPPFWGHSEV